MVKKQTKMGSFWSQSEAETKKNKKGTSNDPKTLPNYRFYMNEIESKPSGAKIDTIHKNWSDDFDKLELHHSYIQWLFPLFEGNGVNSAANALDKEEAREMRKNVEIGMRFVQSYKMMLRFYGMKLNTTTGDVRRHPKYYRDQYRNLDRRFHNNLRITRILRCLSQLGFAEWKFKWLLFLEEEILKNGELQNCKISLNRFWLPLRDVDSKEYLENTLEEPEDREEHVYLTFLKEQAKNNNNEVPELDVD